MGQSLSYVPIEPGFEGSRRMQRFIKALPEDKQENGIAYILRLLLWAGVHAEDGNLGDSTPAEIESDCKWNGKPGVLFEAMVSGGWIFCSESGLEIEGWDRHGGRVAKKREEWAEAKRRQRADKKMSKNVLKDVPVKLSKVKLSKVKLSKDPITCPEQTSCSEPAAVITIPTKAGEQPITQKQVDDWADTYQTIDVMQQLKACRAWNLANPARQKTKRGVLRHVNSWLSRAAERPPQQQASLAYGQAKPSTTYRQGEDVDLGKLLDGKPSTTYRKGEDVKL